MKKPAIIAHRGASAYAPENTMASFKKALHMKADGIELDVQLSKDGNLVVIHDERVNRTSNGTGWVKDLTLNELKKMDFGRWFSQEFKDERIPLLEEVMELIKGWDGLLNIEIKNGPVFYAGIEEKTADIIHRFGMLDRVIVSSFNHYSLVKLKKIDRRIKTAVLYMEGLFEPWDYAGKLGASAIHPLFHSIVPEIVNGCKKHGIAVNPFTVDQPEYIRKMAMAGVDGIITNVPDLALKTVKDLEGI